MFKNNSNLFSADNYVVKHKIPSHVRYTLHIGKNEPFSPLSDRIQSLFSKFTENVTELPTSNGLSYMFSVTVENIKPFLDFYNSEISIWSEDERSSENLQLKFHDFYHPIDEEATLELQKRLNKFESNCDTPQLEI